MKSILTAVAIAAALAFTSGPALADCFQDLMANTSKMIETAEQKGDTRAASGAKKLSAEAQKLYDAGKQDEAIVRIVKSMEMVSHFGSGGR